MIGLLANPKDLKLVKWIKSAVKSAGYQEDDLQVFPAEYDHDYHLEGRRLGAKIQDMDACIIDVEHKGDIGISVKLGSLGNYVRRRVGERRYDDEQGWDSPLDSRIVLLVRSGQQRERMTDYFGSYYSMISIEEGLSKGPCADLAKWLQETVPNAAPRVFISYRSSQATLAKRIAKRLQTLGAAIWLDAWEIRPGDSIPKEINRGLGWCTHLVLLVDDTFVHSEWTSAEVDTMLYRSLSGRIGYRGYRSSRPIIPLFFVDPKHSSLPPMLTRIRGIDCRDASHLKRAIEDLWTAISIVGPR